MLCGKDALTPINQGANLVEASSSLGSGWGETASMVARNQKQANLADLPPLDMACPPPPAPTYNGQPQPNRHFGEIGASALAGSGALGVEGNRALRVHDVQAAK